jgi:hypothetical protein
LQWFDLNAMKANEGFGCDGGSRSEEAMVMKKMLRWVAAEMKMAADGGWRMDDGRWTMDGNGCNGFGAP